MTQMTKDRNLEEKYEIPRKKQKLQKEEKKKKTVKKGEIRME